MPDGYPLDYEQHLQEVSQGLLNGTLDKVSAVNRLIRKGWDKEEASATVADVAEQVETTKKLLRDAARVLDDTPLGQVRASARLQEAGLSQPDADALVKNFNQLRHLSRGKIRYVVSGLRHRHLSRQNAIIELTQHGGMDEAKASTFVDVLTDSAIYWSRERMFLWLALLAGTIACTAVIASFLFTELAGWLGLCLSAFVALPSTMYFFSWRAWSYWKTWKDRNEPNRACPRNCSPMIMLLQGKGEQAAILTCTEWGIPREEAVQLVGYRCRVNRRDHACVAGLGALLIIVSTAATIVLARMEPHDLFPMILIALSMIAAACYFVWRGLRGWRLFARP